MPIITQQELIARQLAAESTSTLEFILWDLIRDHDTREMERGRAYYHNDSEIRKRQIFYYDEHGQRVEDRQALNNRVPHNWHKLLVDQKVSYLLGRPMVIDASGEKESPEQEYVEFVNDYLDEDWDDLLQEIGKEASNKGVSYLHPYIDEQGEFGYVRIPAEQIIPVYDTDYQREVVKLIRYYEVWVNGRRAIRAEWWDADTVSYYLQNDEGRLELETLADGGPNPSSHFYLNGKGYGWGRVPFVEFRNNEEKYGDLLHYRELIDVYDLIVSDMANDMTGIQKLTYVLRGYQGTSLKEFMENLRYYRSIKVDEAGGVDTLTVDIPVEAIDSFLDRQEENIFTFGQGVNIKTDRFGNSPSGIALKFLYGALDLKAAIMARKFSKAIKAFLWFLTEYLGTLTKQMAIPADVLENVSVTFGKSLLINDLELVQMAAQSKGIISDATIVANHPWVGDAQAEVQQMEQEQAGQVDLDDVDDEDEDDPDGAQP